MAVFQCSYRSRVQGRSVFFNVIIPEQCEDDIPVVYMLHGTNATAYDWIKALSIERYATARSIAVVMPSCDNSYFCDMKYGYRQYTYLMEELIPYCRKMFRLSEKREKNFVSGLSMGGYGAMRTALLNPDVFAAAAPMSGVFDIYDCWCGGSLGNSDKTIPITVWGEDYENVLKLPEYDLYKMVESFESSGRQKPWIYQCCGTEDFLNADNNKFREFMSGRGFRYEFEQWKGAHTWDFWDEALPKVFDFFKKYMKENGVEQCLNGRFPSSVVKVD